jgi:hypothetical protein
MPYPSRRGPSLSIRTSVNAQPSSPPSDQLRDQQESRRLQRRMCSEVWLKKCRTLLGCFEKSRGCICRVSLLVLSLRNWLKLTTRATGTCDQEQGYTSCKRGYTYKRSRIFRRVTGGCSSCKSSSSWKAGMSCTVEDDWSVPSAVLH